MTPRGFLARRESMRRPRAAAPSPCSRSSFVTGVFRPMRRYCCSTRAAARRTASEHPDARRFRRGRRGPYLQRMRTAILDPFSGISGDMTLGALLGVGLDPEWLRALPARMGLEEV